MNLKDLVSESAFKCDHCEKEPTSISIVGTIRTQLCIDHGGQPLGDCVSFLYRPENYGSWSDVIVEPYKVKKD